MGKEGRLESVKEWLPERNRDESYWLHADVPVLHEGFQVIDFLIYLTIVERNFAIFLARSSESRAFSLDGDDAAVCGLDLAAASASASLWMRRIVCARSLLWDRLVRSDGV